MAHTSHSQGIHTQQVLTLMYAVGTLLCLAMLICRATLLKESELYERATCGGAGDAQKLAAATEVAQPLAAGGSRGGSVSGSHPGIPLLPQEATVPPPAGVTGSPQQQLQQQAQGTPAQQLQSRRLSKLTALEHAALCNKHYWPRRVVAAFAWLANGAFVWPIVILML
jgi:hypothetical protein